MALGGASVTDPFTQWPRFSHLLKSSTVYEAIFEDAVEVESELFPEENDGFPKFTEHPLNYSPIFEAKVESKSKKNLIVEVRLEPLEVIYSKPCSERIRAFLQTPSAVALYNNLESMTTQQLEQWKEERLNYMMNK